MRRQRKIGLVSQLALDDEWQREATRAAIAAARGVIRTDGAIPPNTPVGRLSDLEWGWIVAAVLFGWISTRARQAVAESLDTEQTVRLTALDPDPWDAGAAMAILPELAATCSDLDWSKPLTAWSRETMAEFLITAMPLIRKAMIARDLGGKASHASQMPARLPARPMPPLADLCSHQANSTTRFRYEGHR